MKLLLSFILGFSLAMTINIIGINTYYSMEIEKHKISFSKKLEDCQLELNLLENELEETDIALFNCLHNGNTNYNTTKTKTSTVKN